LFVGARGFLLYLLQSLLVQTTENCCCRCFQPRSMFGQSESFETARTGTTCSVNVIEHSSSYVLIRYFALLTYTFKRERRKTRRANCWAICCLDFFLSASSRRGPDSRCPADCYAAPVSSAANNHHQTYDLPDPDWCAWLSIGTESESLRTC